jgi:3-phosphoshikimate 1-carboxyvinyltransferase
MGNMDYPPDLEIVPLAVAPNVTVSVPGSKSITNRALVLAALSDSTSYGCKVKGVLRSEDTDLMVDCLRKLGIEVEDVDPSTILVHRGGSADFVPDDEWIPNGRAELFVGNSGTTIRFLTAFVALGEGSYRLDGIPRMRQRPIQDLLDALNQLGVDARSELGNGCPPVIVHANGIRGGHVHIRADVSSQFLSGIMMVAPYAHEDVTLEITGPVVSEPYIEMTIGMLQRFNLEIHAESANRYVIPGRQRQATTDYFVEPDASSASYFLGSAAITNGTVGIPGLMTSSIQGDVRFLDALEEMGCSVCRGRDSIGVTGRPLRGIDVDMNDISDTVMTLAAVACFAEGPTTIRNVAHIRHKETDRISAMATELRKLGAEVEEYPDGLKITPRPLKGCVVETYNDHRMAMSLALIGLKVPGVISTNPGCVAKTYPGFWQDFEKLRG